MLDKPLVILDLKSTGTGITNEMVADAPLFRDLSTDLVLRLRGKVLFAHNARFDYGFLVNEFRRCGITFREQTLCTVQLSRKLYPKERIREHHGESGRTDVHVMDRWCYLGTATNDTDLDRLIQERPTATLETC
jgi:DNA polymerase III epsilon subunit-like protein